MKENPIAVVRRDAVAAVADAILSPKKNKTESGLCVSFRCAGAGFSFGSSNISASIQMVVIKLLQVTAGERIELSKGNVVTR
jgi:hypothetical protein